MSVNLQERVLKFEGKVIARALRASDGRVTRAATALGLTHQGLVYILNNRHKNLLSLRRKARPRRKTGAHLPVGNLEAW